MKIDLEMSRLKAMQYLHLTRMPKKVNHGEIWSCSIVRVMKNNGMEYYAVQGIDSEGNLIIKADFEELHSIVKVVESYPILPFKPCIDKKPIDMCSVEEMSNWLSSTLAERGMEAEDLEGVGDYELFVKCIRLMRKINYSEVLSKLK